MIAARALLVSASLLACGVAPAWAQGVSADEVLAGIEEPDAVDPNAPPPAPIDPFGAAAADPFATPDMTDPVDDFRSVIEGDHVVLRGLNKVTAATQDFTVNFNEPLQFGSLTVLARYCSRRPPELIPETFVFLEIFDRTFDGAETTEYGQKIFNGWMLGSSPALHGLEHPVYDIWPVACQAPGDAETVAAAAAAAVEAEEAAAAQAAIDAGAAAPADTEISVD